MRKTITDKRFHKLLRNAYGLNDLEQYLGAFFSNHCPKCGKKAKMPGDFSVNKFMSELSRDIPHTIRGRCAKCGGVDLPFVGFEEDIFGQERTKQERKCYENKSK